MHDFMDRAKWHKNRRKMMTMKTMAMSRVNAIEDRWWKLPAVFEMYEECKRVQKAINLLEIGKKLMIWFKFKIRAT